VLGVAAHIGHWDECDALIETVLAKLGRIDILVNNAGMAPLYEHLHEASEELFDKTIGVNLKGPFRLSSLAAQSMTGSGGGSIINISSVAALRPTQYEIPYGAAKAGLHILTAGIALGYGPSVRANTIMAGPFLTDIADAWDMPAFEEFVRAMPLRRAGQPDEIVGAALYFASDLSRYTTGAMLRVDGGQALVRR
jgi:NAD(P)-dependent dehydrogenase (short-subunit alcohol dehydrogenase family)